MPNPEIIELLLLGTELRHVEFKQSMDWNLPETKSKVIKAIMAMSNIRDGGYLIFGIEDSTCNPVGMSQSDYDSFNIDDVKSKVSSSVDPYANFEMSKVEYDSKLFIVFIIHEFDNIPVLCKSGGPDNSLKVGGLYTRSKRMNETTLVSSANDMRDIIELAVDKEIQKFIQRSMKAGILTQSNYPEDDSNLFDNQLKDFEL